MPVRRSVGVTDGLAELESELTWHADLENNVLFLRAARP